MSESFIPASEFETASNAVSNILGQPVEEIKITDILPPLNDIADSNKVFYTKTLIISKKPGNTGISRDMRTEFTTHLLHSD